MAWKPGLRSHNPCPSNYLSILPDLSRNSCSSITLLPDCGDDQTCTICRPASAKSVRHCASVRSTPLKKSHMHISRLAVSQSTSVSGTTLSTTSTRESTGSTANARWRRIWRHSASAQSWRMLLSKYTGAPINLSADPGSCL